MDDAGHDPAWDAIAGWIIERGLRQAAIPELLGGVCERLVAAGVALTRGHLSARTLHPSIDGIGHTWYRSGRTGMQTFAVGGAVNPEWQASPLRHLVESRRPRLRRRLAAANEPLDFPMLEALRAEGATDYLALLQGFAVADRHDGPTGMVTSWTTDSPGGFTDAQAARLEALMPVFGLAVSTRLAREIAAAALDTYVGRQAGQRVLSGRIHLGSSETISAVILVADFRGFTALSDRLPAGDLAPLLNAHFARLVPPILEAGGEVLKYVGDGLLAVFTGPRDEAIHGAVAAAERATAALDAAAAADGPAMRAGIALHAGDVVYGNIGAADRLDFTVIGRAVNEAARIEALCRDLGETLILSDAAAAVARDAGLGPRLRPLGAHVLRGVSRPQPLFALDPSCEERDPGCVI